MSTILIGVDSGGTRSNIRISDDGQIASYESSDSLSGSLAPVDYARTLRQILMPADGYLLNTPAARRVSIFISAAGFAPAFREDFLDAINTVVPDVLSGRVSSFGIANDAPTLLLGQAADAAVIAGTGSNVLVRDRNGKLFQVGGHEWVVSDYGSGFWIGLQAIRKAYRDHESDTNTVLLQRLTQEYGVRANEDRRLIAKFRDLAIADSNMKPEIARFAASVCAAAERGDEASQNIVKVEAEDLADVLAGSLRRRFTQEQLADGIRIVECGGLLSNGFYSRAFRSQVEMRLQSGRSSATIDWHYVTTGTDAALNLAETIVEADHDLMQVEAAYRPLIVRFS